MVKIKVFVPTYFDKFKCIADRCPDTCCIGWEVDIDDETAEKYSSLNGDISDKIKNHLTRDDTGCNIFTLCDGDRCPFLNNCNLCEIHLEAGESFLSRTCTLFPRFFDDFGAIREMGLGFGCPEAARIILSENEPFSLKLYEEVADESEDIDEDFLNELLSLRNDIFLVLQDENLSFRDKAENILNLAKIFQENLDGDICDEGQNRTFRDCLTVLENMEYINNERKSFLKNLEKEKITENIFSDYKSDFEKLMTYYIFRYLLKAVYDYDVLTKVKYGIFACAVIGRIYAYFKEPDFEKRVEIMYSYSKEVEYSDMNMDLLDDMMYSSFSTEDLIKLL